MEILEIKERDDGYCDLEVEITEEEVSFLLNYAFNDILNKQIEDLKKIKDIKEE